MKTQLRAVNYILISALICFFQCAKAQIIYTDVNPDNVSSCTSVCIGGSNCSESFNIDLNQDGQTDFTLSTLSAPNGYFPCLAWVRVSALNGNEVSCDNASWPLAIDTNSEIFGGIWASSLASLRGETGNIFYGLWLDSDDRYLGVRLMIASNFYYGWVRLGVSITGGSSKHASCTTKDYAYNIIPDSPILAGDSGIPLAVSTPLSENNFSVFPNPSSNKTRLSFSSSEKRKIQITNTLGQIVFAEEINSAKEDIDVSEFPAGMYVVGAQTSTQKIEKKFLRQ